MKLPLRVRITAWYFAVLAISFAALAWISDIGFQHSIEKTVDDASRANLESVQTVLLRSAPNGLEELRGELNELGSLWADAGLLEVSEPDGELIFQSPLFAKPYTPLPPVTSSETVFLTNNLDFSQYRIAMRKVMVGDHVFMVRAAIPTEPFDQALDRFRVILQATLPVLIVLASLAGYWLSGRALAPVNEIVRTARSVGVQDLAGRLAVPSAKDELRLLSETLNEMLSRIETSVKRITQFTADASHDLRTPVALIRASAELALRRSRSESEYRETLSRILAASEETTRLIENLLTLARADAGATDLRFTAVDLLAHVEKVVSEAAILAAEKSVAVQMKLGDRPVRVSADSAAIDRLLLILVENAVKYTPSGGMVEVSLLNGGRTACIEVRDNGIGIPEKDLPHIFERFYRADRARSRDPGGSGLGLAIARWIVDMHGGAIEARSVVGCGSQFRISLPSAEKQ